jgi:hypothetical protein
MTYGNKYATNLEYDCVVDLVLAKVIVYSRRNSILVASCECPFPESIQIMFPKSGSAGLPDNS